LYHVYQNPARVQFRQGVFVSFCPVKKKGPINAAETKQQCNSSIKKHHNQYLFYAASGTFFLLDQKEPKNHVCQKETRNSTAHFTEILKLLRQSASGQIRLSARLPDSNS
jgi:hypothetical protein